MTTPVISMASQRRLRAIALNKKAISEIQLGKYEHSIRLISRALKCLKGDVQGSSSIIGGADSIICEAMDRYLTEILCGDGGCDRMKDGQYLFTRALLIPNFAANSHQSNALATKVLMFNLGLTYQMMATQRSGADMYQCLQKASRLYRLCHQVPTRQPVAQRHLLPALINNLGMVYLKMKEESRACRFFQQLMAMVMHANSVGNSTYRCNDNIDCFLANACNAQPNRCRTASAA